MDIVKRALECDFCGRDLTLQNIKKLSTTPFKNTYIWVCEECNNESKEDED